MRKGYITGPVLGALWMVVIATTIAVTMSFATGAAFRPQVLLSLIWGAVAGLVYVRFPARHAPARLGVAALLGLSCLTGFGPVLIGSDTTLLALLVTVISVAVVMHVSLAAILKELPFAELTRHEYEDAVIRFCTGFGYIFFTAIVIIPFYVMVMTSLKSQQALLQNPLDFSVDLSQGMGFVPQLYRAVPRLQFRHLSVDVLLCLVS